MYCQNRLCHYNNTADRLRAKKSEAPYYVNRTARGYHNMFCSQRCFHEYFEMYKDRIQSMIGVQGKRTRKATEDGPWVAWQEQPEYNLPWNEGYADAKARFEQQWVATNLKD